MTSAAASGFALGLFLMAWGIAGLWGAGVSLPVAGEGPEVAPRDIFTRAGAVVLRMFPVVARWGSVDHADAGGSSRSVAPGPQDRESLGRGRESLGPDRESAGWIGRVAVWGVTGLVSSILLFVSGLVLPALAIAGFGVAWPHLQRVASRQQRRERIRRALPAFLDVLESAVRAGAALEPALLAVAHSMPGDLADEIVRTLQELRLGVPRNQALRNLAARCRCDEVERVVASMIRSSQFGTPLADALAATAKDSRRAFRQAARRRASRVQPRVSLVVTLLVVPGILLPIAAALFVVLAPNMQGVLGGGG